MFVSRANSASTNLGVAARRGDALAGGDRRALHAARVSTSSGTDIWVVVAALGAAVGGVAGAVAAVAAWRSANASRATSRDALEALAVGIFPTLSVRTQGDVVDDTPTGKVSLTIGNESLRGWAASDLMLEIRHRDGHVDRHQRERMNPPGPDGGLDLRWVLIENGSPVVLGVKRPDAWAGSPVGSVGFVQ